MQLTQTTNPLVKLPSNMDLVLYLIREELKSRKFFNTLRKAGLHDCVYQPNLDSLILTQVGLDGDTGETFHFYNTLMEKRSRKLTEDPEHITRQAMKVYTALLEQKERSY